MVVLIPGCLFLASTTSSQAPRSVSLLVMVGHFDCSLVMKWTRISVSRCSFWADHKFTLLHWTIMFFIFIVAVLVKEKAGRIK